MKLFSLTKRYAVYILSLCLAAPLLASCGETFNEIKTGEIAIDPSSLLFVPGTTGTRETSRLIQVSNKGEAPLTLFDVYLEEQNGESRSRIEGCDFETEMIPDTTLLLPEVLPTCSLIIRNRPDQGSQVEPGQFRQVELVYRPIDGLDSPIRPRLIIENSSTEDPRIEIEIEIMRGTPDISQNISVLQFPGGAPGRQSYLVRNLGSAPLTISSITIELSDPESFPAPPSGELEFSFDANQELRDLQIDPDGSPLRLQVAYNPEDEGADQAYLVIDSNDPDEPQFKVLLTSEARAATLEVTPTPVVFTHASNATDTQVVSFNNTGLRPINVFLSVESEGEAYRIHPSDIPNFQVAAGSEQSVRIEYNAGQMATEGTLIVEAAEAENFVNGELRVPLRTNESASLKLLELDEQSLVFDGVAGGESLEQTLTITSSGDDPVEVSAIEFEGSEVDLAVFSVDDAQSGTLNPGESREITITFTRPADEPAANAYQASLLIRNDGLGGDLLVTLVANP